MRDFAFPDGNVFDLLVRRDIDRGQDVTHKLQIHSSLVRRLSLEQELEGHQGCVNALAWNSSGSLLISGSDDARVNIWSYVNKSLVYSIDTGHSANIFCTKFVPETCDELVASGAGDAEVRLFRVSRLSGSSLNSSEPSALFRCHSRRVKKLAVEDGNPNVVWSASEDGTLRQHDFREGVSCPPAGSSHQECRNILLDLRSGAKRSLADNPRHCLGLKSCDISPTRPHQLLIGGSDAFCRLYDRRMLPPLSSSEKRMKPPPCVNYFCPVHLSDHGRPSLHLTHVAFSPNGEEVLLSYSGEHVYLMDVNPGGDCNMRYRATDVPKQMSFDSVANVDKVHVPVAQIMLSDTNKSWLTSSMAHKCNKLLQYAGKSLEEESDYLYAIEACSEVLDGKGHYMEDALRHDFLCTRAALLLKRQWKNDVHISIRDCKEAWAINPSSLNAHYHMAEALSQLERHKDALEYAIVAQSLAPSNAKVNELVGILRENVSAGDGLDLCMYTMSNGYFRRAATLHMQICMSISGYAEAESEKNSKELDEKKPDERRARSLSELLYRSEVENSDTSQDGPSFEREDSDYDDEMELDFETSISGDEDHDIESGILRGSLNLRFHRRGDSAKYSNLANGSCGSSSSRSESRFQPEVVIDMKQRYVGHCNVGTDIKQASFLGCKGEYVASGSDDGRWFIWEKRTGRLIKMLAGDENVVNCVQCHPFDCAIATSGIDHTVKLWTPRAQMPSVVAGGTAGPEIADVVSAIESNQHKMSRSREPISPFEILERFRMHDFTEGTIHPFECSQS